MTVSRFIRQGIAVFFRIKYEYRIATVDFLSSDSIEYMDIVFKLSMQRMSETQHREEQVGEGLLICNGGRARRTHYHFRSHVSRCADNISDRVFIDHDIVVVADHYISGFRTKHEVVVRDIPVAESRDSQFSEAFRQLSACLGHDAETWMLPSVCLDLG